MRKPRSFLIFLFLLIFQSCLVSLNYAQTSYLTEWKGHDQFMLDVLFKNFKVVDNDPSIKAEIEALECASYLTIDQFNGFGQNYLNTLKDYRVKNIPKSISAIDFSASGKTHRTYSHRGWDYHYLGATKELMPIRKQILINTADAIFDFKGDEKQKESFCALIYYVHILGDFMEDKSYKIDNGLKMDAGGRIDKEDIIHEIEKHLQTLFPDQQNTNKYRYLVNALERYNTKLLTLVRSKGGIDTDERFQERQEYVEGVMNVLTMYLPEMLKEEEFFNEVFYCN